ncbi:cytochrome C [Helicobacter sp. 11S02596-1]|uniref:cytochrome C n=1 Tax=Helicobacter sp. 11S02596-1 TaxID=1476194 RepID=UPI000BA5394C|nr:cytochrome C [Helicobacter sp. 11S02596-1]PAF44803.1 hypothetical protein BJI48_02110 [Helicobacter sp. 11S02596-1]
MRKISLWLIVGLMSCLGAKDVFYAETTKQLYLDPNSTKVIGKLLPTSQVKIIKETPTRLLLGIEGYTQEGVDNAIYYVVGKRILVAGLSKNSGAKLKVLATQKDPETKNVYNKVYVELYADKGDMTPDLQALYKKANDLYVQSCSSCHPSHEPREFGANQWPSVVKSMINRTGLSKDDGYLLTQYLQKHSKDFKETK